MEETLSILCLSIWSLEHRLEDSYYAMPHAIYAVSICSVNSPLVHCPYLADLHHLILMWSQELYVQIQARINLQNTSWPYYVSQTVLFSKSFLVTAS